MNKNCLAQQSGNIVINGTEIYPDFSWILAGRKVENYSNEGLEKLVKHCSTLKHAYNNLSPIPTQEELNEAIQVLIKVRDSKQNWNVRINPGFFYNGTFRS